MTKKKPSTEAAVRDIRREPVGSSLRKRRSGSCSRASGVSRASPSFAAGQASRRMPEPTSE